MPGYANGICNSLFLLIVEGDASALLSRCDEGRWRRATIGGRLQPWSGWRERHNLQPLIWHPASPRAGSAIPSTFCISSRAKILPNLSNMCRGG